jgi:hypothetical protein
LERVRPGLRAHALKAGVDLKERLVRQGRVNQTATSTGPWPAGPAKDCQEIAD